MDRPRLLVLGSGFGGFSLLRSLPPGLFDTTLISPRNHFLFTPLLASATAGTVELRSIVEPVRRRLPSVRFFEAEAVSVDWNASTVTCRSVLGDETFSFPWDLLVVAVGAGVGDYGLEGVREHCLFLKELGDARRIRRRVLEQLARAEIPGLDEDEAARHLTLVVCGGGPTGVEIAAEIHDLVADELRREFPRTASRVRIVVLEALERLLSGFDEALSSYTGDHFRRSGIEVRTSSPVRRVEADRVVLEDGEEIPCGLTIWAGGNAPRRFVENLGLELDRGRIRVDERLRVIGRPSTFAIGDCAAVDDSPLPATAQVAQQQGAHLAESLVRVRRGLDPKPFEFGSQGMLAYIGGGKALADLPRATWSGRSAWLFWRSVYITKLVSVSNKVKVLFDWIKTAVFGRDTTRF